MAALRITLIKSLIGQKPVHKSVAASLGLKKIGDITTHEEGAVLSGKISKIAHLVKVEKAAQ